MDKNDKDTIRGPLAVDKTLQCAPVSTARDGSLTLYFQNESPGKDEEANWLPAPKGEFIPMLRMYWPKDAPPSVIDGTWKPPMVQKAG